MRILIAEDNLTSRIVLAGVLKKSGHEVVEVLTGAAAWEALQQPDAPAGHPGLDDAGNGRAGGGAPGPRPATDCQPYFIMLSVKSEKTDIIAGLEAGPTTTWPSPSTPASCWPASRSAVAWSSSKTRWRA